MRISDWSSDVCSSDLWLTLCFRWAFEPAGVVTDHGENGRHFLWLPAQRRDFAVPQALRSTRGEVRPDPRAVASDQGVVSPRRSAANRAGRIPGNGADRGGQGDRTVAGCRPRRAPTRPAGTPRLDAVRQREAKGGGGQTGSNGA